MRGSNRITTIQTVFRSTVELPIKTLTMANASKMRTRAPTRLIAVGIMKRALSERAKLVEGRSAEGPFSLRRPIKSTYHATGANARRIPRNARNHADRRGDNIATDRYCRPVGRSPAQLRHHRSLAMQAPKASLPASIHRFKNRTHLILSHALPYQPVGVSPRSWSGNDNGASRSDAGTPSSIRDVEACCCTANRGLKPTATIRGSLRDLRPSSDPDGSAHGASLS